MSDALQRHADARERQRLERQREVFEGVGRIIKDRDELTEALREAATALTAIPFNPTKALIQTANNLAGKYRRLLAGMARR